MMQSLMANSLKLKQKQVNQLQQMQQLQPENDSDGMEYN